MAEALLQSDCESETANDEYTSEADDRGSSDEVAEENDKNDIAEAQLQQDRLDYFQQAKLRDEEDSQFARKLLEEELLQAERARISQQLKDEGLARQILEQEQLTMTMQRSISLQRSANPPVQTNTNLAADLVNFEYVDIPDEVEAELGRHAEAERLAFEAEQRDAHLARVLQQMELQRYYVQPQLLTPPMTPVLLVSSAVTPPMVFDNGRAQPSPAASQWSQHRSLSLPDGAVTPDAGDRKRRRRSSRKASCKQQ